MKRTIIEKLWTGIKWYLKPIVWYLFSEAKKERFNVRVLAEKAKDNKEYLADKLATYNEERLKLATERLNNIVSSKIRDTPWYAGTIDDSDEMWGGTSVLTYTGQELPKIKYKIYEYDQLEHRDQFGSTQCFYYGNLWEASDNLDIQFTKEERYAGSVSTTKSKWYDINYGGYFSEWRRITDYQLTQKGLEFQTYRFATYSKWLRHVLDAWYSVTLWIRISQDMLKWLRLDWYLSNDEITWENSYNHLIRIKRNEAGTIDMWIDNYKNTQRFNVFQIEDIELLAQAGKFMNSSYFVAPVGKSIPKIEEAPTEPKITPPAAKADISKNRYAQILQDKIDNWYEPLFNNIYEEWEVNSWEVKALIEIALANKWL